MLKAMGISGIEMSIDIESLELIRPIFSNISLTRLFT